MRKGVMENYISKFEISDFDTKLKLSCLFEKLTIINEGHEIYFISKHLNIP